MKFETNELKELVVSLEKYFKKDYSKIKEFIEESNYTYEENNNSFCLTGYTEIHDFFRFCVNFRELEKYRFELYKIEITENEILFYDFYDKVLFKKSLEQQIDVKGVSYKALNKFFKDGV